jgi:RNA polymerase sigma factor (sigma-70 family)
MDETDGELLAATAGGDPEAFARFYCRYERLIVGYAIRHCVNVDDVGDLVGETFLGALRSAARFTDHDGEDAIPWLFGIAHRVLSRQRRSFVRRQRLNRRLESLPTLCSDEADAIDAALDASRLAPVLASALSQLKAKDQELVQLVHRDGLSPAQAGRVLGMNPNTARLRLSRARARLRDLLAESSSPHPTVVSSSGVCHVQP